MSEPLLTAEAVGELKDRRESIVWAAFISCTKPTTIFSTTTATMTLPSIQDRTPKEAAAARSRT
jgi:hypothetical protein